MYIAYPLLQPRVSVRVCAGHTCVRFVSFVKIHFLELPLGVLFLEDPFLDTRYFSILVYEHCDHMLFHVILDVETMVGTSM